MTLKIILIISDDLTGATVSVAGFLSRGISPRISLGFDLKRNHQAAVEVIDPDVWEKQAYQVTESIRHVLSAENSEENNPQLTLFLKIDSTLRVHVRAYAETLISTTPEKTIIICSAFPELGQTVEQGLLTRTLGGAAPSAEGTEQSL